MAQRDHDEQPDAPDLGASVQLDAADTLDGPAGSADGLDAGYIPPDRPFALDEDGVTGAGMRAGDSLDDRLGREEPEEPMDDATPVDDTRSGRLVIAGEGAALETSDAIDAVDVGIDGGAASAEEAAVHVEDVDGASGLAGAPVETEPAVAGAPELADPEVDALLAADTDPEVLAAERDAARDNDDPTTEAVPPAGTPDRT